MRPSDKLWWMNLQVDWTTGIIINGKKFYATKEGCLVIHPDGKTLQYFGKNWFE